MKKISSEANKDELPHFDLLTSLIKLDKEMSQFTQCGRLVNGYIQRITAKPFSVLLFTEEGVRIYHHLAEKQTIYLDATGTIVSLKGTDYEGKSSLYYSLVVGHPNKGQPPVSVAELIATEHSVLAISHFLDEFRSQEGRLYGYQHVVPKHVIVDTSLVLLLSFLKAMKH